MSASRSRPATSSSRTRSRAAPSGLAAGRGDPGAALRDPRHRPAVRAVRGGRPQPLRAHRLRAPRARPADRLLLRAPAAAGAIALVAHAIRSSSPCPPTSTDEEAVMIEPTACAVHAAAACTTAANVAVIGAGTARPADARRPPGRDGGVPSSLIAPSTPPQRSLAAGSAPHRRASRPSWLASCAPDRSSLVARRAAHRRRRSGLRLRRLEPVAPAGAGGRPPRRQVVLVGMPATVTLDLTGLWHREVSITAATRTGARTSPPRSGSSAGSGSGGSSAPPTHSTATPPPSPTPPTPAPAARSRSRST